MRDIVTNQRLWSNIGINKRKLLSEGITALFSVPRFEATHTVDLSRGWFSKGQWYDILTQVVNSSHPIEELNLAEAQLNDVELDLFVAAICNVRKVNLARVQGQHLHWENIFMKIENSSKIEQIDLSENILVDVPVELFAGTLSKLDQVELKDALITNQQLQALISRSKDTKTKLSANIICENLHQPPVHLPSAFLHLQKLSLYLEDPTSLTWRSVVEALASSSVLSEVNIEGVGVNMAQVPPGLLASSLSRLGRVRLSGVELSGEQWRAVVASLTTSLTTSELGLRMVNLTPVSPASLARAVSRLTSLSLEYAVLTEEQWQAVLSSCPLTPSLSSLTISYINLANIQPHLLASLTLTCAHLDLSHTGLLPSQLELLLSSVPRSSVIRDLSLQGLDLSAVEDSVIARASLYLVRVSLRKTRLSIKQSTALLVANLGRSRLKVLDLSHVNLSGVDSDLLALSLTRFREVDLSCTWLTKEQIVRLVKQVSKFTKLEFLKLQSATASLLNQEMKQTLTKNLKLVIF